MTKADVAGSLAASQLICAMLGMIFAPILGSAMADGIGFEWTTTILGIVVFAILIPSMWLLLKYAEPPTKGPFAKKPDKAEDAVAAADSDGNYDADEKIDREGEDKEPWKAPKESSWGGDKE